MSMKAQPATAESGHFTKPIPLENTYISDPSLRRALAWYLPAESFQQIEPQLVQLGAEAISPQIREWSADAERNQPYVKSYNVWGERYDYDRLITTEGWKRLGKWGAKHGVVALGYEPTYGPERRLAQYAVNYLFSPSSGLSSCPISMTDGAALILTQQVAGKPPSHPFHTILKRVLSRGEDFWTSGQWMTERAGGSDVQNTETWATYSPPTSPTGDQDAAVGEGDYLISGFKFFSSATDANISLLLAKTPSGKLSTFVAPLRRTIRDANGATREVTNGVRIHRLKNKLGTKELPTAELELKDMRAHLVGELDRGVPTIAPLLNITRTHTFVGSLAGWRRAISIAKSFARARTTVGEPLWLIPMHLRLMAEMEVRHRGAAELAWFTVAVMGIIENNRVTGGDELKHLPKPGKEATVVFRSLTAIAKAVVSKMAVVGIQECQEAMGGVGYMDEPDEPEFNISRVLRNTLVNSIWEGTTNVLASEFVRFLAKGDNLGVFAGWMERVLRMIQNKEVASALTSAWRDFKAKLAAGGDPAMILADGRRAMFTLAWILCGVLLALDAQRDGDAVTTEIAGRWILAGEGGVGDTVWRDIIYHRNPDKKVATDVNEECLRWDCRIAWGEELPAMASGHRSMKL